MEVSEGPRLKDQSTMTTFSADPQNEKLPGDPSPEGKRPGGYPKVSIPLPNPDELFVA